MNPNRVARPTAALAALVLVLLASPLGVNAAAELAIAPTTGEPGTRISAIATGFAPGAPVSFVWDAEPGILLGTASADGAGRAVLDFEVPPDAEPGGHLVRACPGADGCPPGVEEAIASIEVVSRSLLEGDDVGGSVLALLVIAALALGLGAMTGSRLRRTTETFKPPPRKRHDHELDELPEEAARTRRR